MMVQNLAVKDPVKFEVGTYIIHENVGACLVKEIGPLSLVGAAKDKMYYTLEPAFRKDSRLFTPVEGSKVAMRPILSKTAAMDLINQVKELEAVEIIDSKEKERDYQKIIKLCDCQELLRMIKALYIRKEFRLLENKKLASGDEKCLRYARERLLEEFSLAMKITMEEVEELIIHHLTEKI